MGRDSEKGKYASPEGSARWEYIATISCSLYILGGGCVPGWNSPTLGILLGPDSPIPFTPDDASTLTAMITLGHALAPIFTTVMADKLGRRNSMLVASVPPMLSWALIAFTKNKIVFFVARLIGGLSIGWIFCFPQMYLGEIASAKLRGAIAMVCGTMINAGILSMAIIVPHLSIRMTACICLSITTIAMISIWFIPESPYFLAMVGKYDEAEAALEKFRGKNDVAEELELIKNTVENKVKNGREEAGDVVDKSSLLKRLFFVSGNRKALFINLLFIGVLQLGSYISIMAYGQILFGQINSGIAAHVCIIIVACLQLVSNLLCALVIEKLGRKPLIFISGLTSGLCLVSVAVYFYLEEHTKIDVSHYGIFATCALFANVAVLNLGLMPLQHVVQAEVFASDIKGLGTCIIGVAGGVIATIGVKTYITVAITWGYGQAVPFFAFTGITWIGTAIMLKILPETKGKTLLEIQQDLNK